MHKLFFYEHHWLVEIHKEEFLCNTYRVASQSWSIIYIYIYIYIHICLNTLIQIPLQLTVLMLPEDKPYAYINICFKLPINTISNSKEPRIDIDQTSIWHFRVGSMSIWCRPVGFTYLRCSITSSIKVIMPHTTQCEVTRSVCWMECFQPSGYLA